MFSICNVNFGQIHWFHK